MSITPTGTALPVRINGCLRRHPDWSNRRVASAINCRVAVVEAARGHGSGQSPATDKTQASGKTLGDFKRQFDVRERIRAGVKAHLSGVYRTDQDFREVCGVPTTEWRRFADLEEFETYRWRYRGVLYWAQPKMLAAMKDTVGVL